MAATFIGMRVPPQNAPQFVRRGASMVGGSATRHRRFGVGKRILTDCDKGHGPKSHVETSKVCLNYCVDKDTLNVGRCID